MKNPLVLKYQKRDELSVEEESVLEQSVAEIRMIRADHDIVAENSRPKNSVLLVTGFAARYKDLSDGKRQITSLHIDGDFVDLHGFLLKQMDHGVAAITDCTIALVPHENLKRITEHHPHLTRILWLSTLIDAAISREWMVSMGRRSSVAQIAHLVCELYVRLQNVERAGENHFDLPLTQAELGDVLGLSVVHVNRSIKQLREKKLLTWQDGAVTILDWDGLTAIAEFEPSYLNLQNEPR